MGAIFSYLFGYGGTAKVSPADMGPEADIPDSVSTMTQREVAYVQQSWDLVRTDLKTHGVKFFVLLFETHPVLQTRFKPFVGKTLQELIPNKRFHAHATTVMTALDSYVTGLGDIETVVEMLKTTGENHKNRRGVEANDFKLLAPVLIQYLKESLSSIWSEDMEKAWKKLLDVVVGIITSCYNQQ